MSSVIVVEDDVLAAGAAEDVLTSLGHAVRVVPDPRTAIREMLWQRPDVVLAGVRLPPHSDLALPYICERLGIPLMDLLDTICLMGRRDPATEDDLPEPLAPSR